MGGRRPETSSPWLVEERQQQKTAILQPIDAAIDISDVAPDLAPLVRIWVDLVQTVAEVVSVEVEAGDLIAEPVVLKADLEGLLHLRELSARAGGGQGSVPLPDAECVLRRAMVAQADTIGVKRAVFVRGCRAATADVGLARDVGGWPTVEPCLVAEIVPVDVSTVQVGDLGTGHEGQQQNRKGNEAQLHGKLFVVLIDVVIATMAITNADLPPLNGRKRKTNETGALFR